MRQSRNRQRTVDRAEKARVFISKAGLKADHMNRRERWAEGLTQLFDRTLAAVFLFLSLPVIAVIFILHHLIERDGGPFLYRGVRVGKDGELFTIYKIRTLIADAELYLQGKLHDEDKRLELKMGSFLRETRLDELPQLFNVMRGDMALVGPRPERLSVYESMCKDIRGYHERFRVLPGITGLSQFLTPHGTSKRIRARIDLLLARKMKSPLWRLYLVFWTAAAIVRKVFRKVWNMMLRGVSRWAADDGLRNVEIRVVKTRMMDTAELKLEPIEITKDRLHVTSDEWLEPEESVDLVFSRRSSNGRRKQVRCRGQIVSGGAYARTLSEGTMNTYVIEYRAETDLRGYLLQRHVLRKSVA